MSQLDVSLARLATEQPQPERGAARADSLRGFKGRYQIYDAAYGAGSIPAWHTSSHHRSRPLYDAHDRSVLQGHHGELAQPSVALPQTVRNAIRVCCDGEMGLGVSVRKWGVRGFNWGCEGPRLHVE